MNVLSQLGIAFAILTVAALACDWYYSRVHGRHLKWWAIYFANGALLFDKRLKDWER